MLNPSVLSPSACLLDTYNSGQAGPKFRFYASYLSEVFCMHVVTKEYIVYPWIVPSVTRHFFKEYKPYLFEHGEEFLTVLTWNHVMSNLQASSLNSDTLALSFMYLLIFDLLSDLGTPLQVERERSESQWGSVIRNVQECIKDIIWDMIKLCEASLKLYHTVHTLGLPLVYSSSHRECERRIPQPSNEGVRELIPGSFPVRTEGPCLRLHADWGQPDSDMGCFSPLGRQGPLQLVVAS